MLKRCDHSPPMPDCQVDRQHQKGHADALRHVCVSLMQHSSDAFAEVVPEQRRRYGPENSSGKIEEEESQLRHAERSACGWNNDAETEREPAEQQDPVSVIRHPLKDSPVTFAG